MNATRRFHRLFVSTVVRDTAGNLYGTTQFGGAFVEGTVYKLDGATRVLSTFSIGQDLRAPAGVIRDAAGNLYDTTQFGGRMKDDSEKTIVAVESYTIPPGHDGWVEGNQPVAGIAVISVDGEAKA